MPWRRASCGGPGPWSWRTALLPSPAGRYLSTVAFDPSRATIGRTAFWIAGWRAEETARGAHAHIHDPVAALFMASDAAQQEYARLKAYYETEGYRRGVAKSLSRNILGAVESSDGLAAAELFVARSGTFTEFELARMDHVRRTKFIDDACSQAAARGVRQTVIIGAGLDARAFRMFSDTPDMVVYEVDHHDMFNFKEPVISGAGLDPLCRRVTVGLEYSQVSKWHIHATEHGYNPSQPSVFVLEGLLSYLEPDTQLELVATVASVAPPGSSVVGDLYNFPPGFTEGVPNLGPSNADDVLDGIVFKSTDPERFLAALLEAGFADANVLVARSDHVADILGMPELPFWSQSVLPFQRYFFLGTRKGAN